MKKIFICDCTLPILAGSREIPLLAREKNALAQRLAALGVDAVELPPVRNPKEDTIIHKTIAAGIGETVLAVPTGDDTVGIDTAWAGICEAANPALLVSLPVSTVQMEYHYHLKEDKMVDKITKLTSYAKTKGCSVGFVAGDSTRASEDFLCRALSAAVEAGADFVVFRDEAGNLLPEELAQKIKLVKDAVSVPVYVSLSDAIHCACGNAVAALRAGADGVRCAVSGNEVVRTGELAAALSALGDALDLGCNLRETEVYSDISGMLKKIRPTPQSKAAGEGGVSVFLDSDSTPAQVGEAVRALGYDLSADDLGKVCEAVARICEKKSTIGSKELEAVIASSAMQAPSTYHLVSFQSTSSNVANAMACVTLSRGEEIMTGVATGDGPIDCCFRAIEQSIGHHYELDDFQIQAVTEGKEALGAALVRLRSQGRLYSGNGLSADIVGASIRAYVNALNKIVYEETER